MPQFQEKFANWNQRPAWRISPDGAHWHPYACRRMVRKTGAHHGQQLSHVKGGMQDAHDGLMIGLV